MEVLAAPLGEDGPLARTYRQMPLNSICKGSQRHALDVLRAMEKHPRSRRCWLSCSQGVATASRRSPIASRSSASGRSPGARRAIRRRRSPWLQGALPARYAPDFVADAYCASRLAPQVMQVRRSATPAGSDLTRLSRAWPADAAVSP
jgi:putative acyl-CoA dehydrogenase